MKKHLAPILLLLVAKNLSSAHHQLTSSIRCPFKRLVQEEIEFERLRKKEHNGTIIEKYLTENKDLVPFCKERKTILYDRMQHVTCQIHTKTIKRPKHIYQGQRYKIAHRTNLTGPLGWLIDSIYEINSKLHGCQWISTCTSNTTMITLKPEVGHGNTLFLIVPTNRLFDLALENQDGSLYLSVYECS